MRNMHLSKLTGNICLPQILQYSYLFAPDSTSSLEMKELDVMVISPKISASEDLECFVSWGF